MEMERKIKWNKVWPRTRQEGTKSRNNLNDCETVQQISSTFSSNTFTFPSSPFPIIKCQTSLSNYNRLTTIPNELPALCWIIQYFFLSHLNFEEKNHGMFIIQFLFPSNLNFERRIMERLFNQQSFELFSVLCWR